MKLVSQKPTTGNNKNFTFTHRIKKRKYTLAIGAINLANAQRKAWAAVSKEYKKLKTLKSKAYKHELAIDAAILRGDYRTADMLLS